MKAELLCWKCGKPLDAVPLPFSRRAECPFCQIELHVCRMCVYFNPRISDKCDEPQAEHPRELARANFCDYFKPNPRAYAPEDTDKTRATKNQLESLFGDRPQTDTGSDEDGSRQELDQLFNDKTEKDQ